MVNISNDDFPNLDDEDVSKLDLLKGYHLGLLETRTNVSKDNASDDAPIIAADVLAGLSRQSPSLIQHGFFAGINGLPTTDADPRLFFNISSPSSIFICGSQGSGKSHTLSCLLESCLIKSDASELRKPLTGLVFHYDTFISDFGGSPCEAAFLSSNPSIKVRVLCAPTNFRTIKQSYSRLSVSIETLQIDQNELNTRRMLDLMAINSEEGSVPLYIHTVNRILREMRIAQQETGSCFDYQEFKKKIDEANLTPTQRAPLDQRLETLESFMPASQTIVSTAKTKKSTKEIKAKKKIKNGTWRPEPGMLTIVDLSCPCITPEMACCLFNICLSLFIEQAPDIGRIVALDEAHKYMNSSSEASVFTNTLLAAVRLQRHLGLRVVISTQEPTIAPALLDLCSVVIAHRFTSPAWMRSLQAHVAAAACHRQEANGDRDGKKDRLEEMFADIVTLQTGHALLFAPNALISSPACARDVGQRLGSSHLKIQVRSRLTEDGGKSIFAI